MSKTLFDKYSTDLYNANIKPIPRRRLSELHTEAFTHSSAIAWTTLWLYGTRLVLKVVKAFDRLGYLSLSFEDAVAEGNLAIGQGLGRWDPQKGAFSTHIWICVRGSILNANQRELRSNFTGVVDEALFVVGIDGFATGDEGGGYTYNILDTEHVHEDDAEAQLQAIRVRNVVAALPKRERQYIVKHYFGGVTQKDMALSEGVSPAMVGKVIRRALDRMRGEEGLR